MNEQQRGRAIAEFGPIKEIQSATIYHRDWELDNDAWFVEFEDGAHAVLTTNHGGLCDWSEEEARAKLAEMQESVRSISAIIERAWS